VKTGNRQKVTAKSRKAKVSGFALCALLLAHSFPAEAQQPKKVPRIGFLTSGSSSTRSEAFRQGLGELGYVEGKNVIIEYRYAEGKLDRVRGLAAELVRLKVDVIVTGGATNTRAAKEATSTIPIVMAQDPDPVGNGLVASLARPGGNITGLSSLSAELSGKRMELLREVLPKLSRVAVLGTAINAGNARQLRETELAAGTSGVQLLYLNVLGPKDIETALQDAAKRRADAVLVLSGPILNPRGKEIAELAAKSRLPAIYNTPEAVEAGGLLSYGVSLIDLGRRVATYVDKILKGAMPGDLPIEQPTKFELIINLKAAKALGLKIPAHILMEADKVIE
jgi:putative ABC transport system substrate-binding protein